MKIGEQIQRRQSIYWLSIVIIGLITGIGLQFAQAWSNPGSTPPTGNVAGPITTGANAQWKSGALGVRTGAVPSPGFGLAVGGNAVVGGKMYSYSTVATDYNTTIVTKDYVDGKSIDNILATSRSGSWTGDGVKWCNSTYPILLACHQIDDQAPSSVQTMTSCTSDGPCSQFDAAAYPRNNLGQNDIYLERVQKSGGIQGCAAYDYQHSHKPFKLDVTCSKVGFKQF